MNDDRFLVMVSVRSEIPSHQHEQVTQVIEGEFELTVENDTFRLGPNTVAVIEPHQHHTGRAVSACRIIDVFYPVREDYR